jgi:hypothetical protein
VDRTAGFAASVSIRQELIQRLIRVLYNAGSVQHKLTASVPSVTADLFLAVPVVTFQASDSSRVAIDLFGWGPMAVTPPNGSTESRKVKFRCRVLVPQTASLNAGSLVLGFDSSNITVQNVQIDPYSGGLFSPAATAYLLSPDFLTLLTFGLQVAIAQFGSMLPPLDLSALGAIAADPSATVVRMSTDEAVVLGIDLPGVTQGNASLLVDTSAGNDIGMWTNPTVVPTAFDNVRVKVKKKVEDNDATLDDFHLAVQEGWFNISGRASATGGAVNFSLHAVPKLVRPGTHYEWDEEYGEHFEYNTPAYDDLWFDPQDVVVDIDRDWWVTLLEALGGLLTLGIGALVVESLFDMVRGNTYSGITQNPESQGGRNQTFTLPGVSRPPMTLRIETFECHAEGVFVGLTIKAAFWAASFDGDHYIGAEESQTRGVRFKVGLPPDALVDDPELRISWTVRRTDTNAILIAQDSLVKYALSLSFDHNQVPFLEITRLGIEVRLYRTLGAGSEDLFYHLGYLDVTDYVDRSHPYIKWEHDVITPLVRVESDGSHTILGTQMKHRYSNIHRTAIPGRCRMLRQYSTTRLNPPDWRGYPPTYLDNLPFPLDEILQYRAGLCDYCFFGGPTKDVPLIPIP